MEDFGINCGENFGVAEYFSSASFGLFGGVMRQSERFLEIVKW